jgi:spore germination protein KB
MELEKGRISNSQLSVLVVSFLQGMIVTINFAFSFTKQSTWLAVLVSSAIALLTVCIYTTFTQRLPGQDLIQINDTIYGPYLGKLVSLLYIWFFFQVIIHHSYHFNSFWITYIMPETPRAAFLIMFIFICAMAARKGLEVIARCSFLLAAVVVGVVVFGTIMLADNAELSNLLPVINFSAKEFIHSVHMILAIPFGEFVVFIAIFPYASERRRIRKPVLIGVGLSAAQLLIVVTMDTLVLGPRILNSNSASFAAVRLIDIGGVLTRLDILFAITLLVTAFLKIAVFYYVTALSLAQLLKLRSYLPLVIPVGLLVVAISTNLYSSDMEQFYTVTHVWLFNAAAYEFLIPIVTYLVMILRKIPRKEGVAIQ